MNNEEYFLGYDIGTGTVGWAVTDTNYNLIKINRKNAWGSVLFDTSEGAEERRLNRCARRRRRRERERLELLRELFEDEVNKVDKGFFLRLSESRYIPQDKLNDKGVCPNLPYSLFVDEGFTDVEYHKEYPTIYHLRKALMTEDKKFDIRLIYLAIAHILKHRGHFLANMGTDETNLVFEDIFGELIGKWNDLFETEDKFTLDDSKINDIKSVLKDTKLSKNEKKQKLSIIIENNSKEMKELITLIVGGKITLSKIFNKSEYDALEETKLCFDEDSYEIKENYYAVNLGDDFSIIAASKNVYDWMVLSNILKGDTGGLISVAKVRDYEKHKKDLRILKDAIIQDGKGTEAENRKLFKKVFGIPQKGENNYSTYVGVASLNGKKHVLPSCKCIKKDFYAFVDKFVIPNLKEGENKKYIIRQIESEEFMPKARIKENSVIPYQLNKKELKKILLNAEQHYSFFSMIDETGKSVSEKIMLLLEFRIPYYVGPLNNANGKNEHAWVVRKENGRVTPWNFEKMVNIEKSAEEFILKMTSKCTYLKNEDVLPMSSLTYEKYMVLNEINNIKIKSEPISVELKQKIYKNLFEKKLKVTMKKLIDYLKSEGYNDITRDDITGIDIEIKSSLKSYHAFKREFTGIDLSIDDKERIVKDMTLFGAEPKLLKKRLLAQFPNYANQIIALIKSLKCNDWGRLSYKLLNGIAIDIPGQGQVGTIMYQLWNTNDNLSKIITSLDSTYAKIIEEENNIENNNEMGYELVRDLYVSPATKRQIWKAVQIADEVMHAMGHPPKRLFVEMAREHTESKRSVTRKDRLMELYRSIKGEKELLESLKSKDNNELRSDKLYLYYTQLGKCAYTGKVINIEDLSNKNLYDIDHIYPQSKTADDSLENRVLVCKDINGDKSDVYPVDIRFQTKMKNDWKMWKEKGLISDEKYKRLTRTTELTNEELTGFVNRQLVETRQSTKAFIDVMRQILPPETEIVYSKASNVSRFRQKYLEKCGIIKVRELNDLHHAKDAYLNIVVGNVYHLKFTKDVRKYFMEKGTYRTYNLLRMFDYNVIYYDEQAWKAGDNGTLRKVKDVMKCDKVLVSRQVYERKGALFKVQPLKKGKGQVPLKSGKNNERLKNIDKYGGYDSATITYFSLIEGEKKGKKVRYIVPVPLYITKAIEADRGFANDYYKKEYDLNNIVIIKQKIRIQTLFVNEGFKMRITGKSGNQIIFDNANQLNLDIKYHKVIKEACKFVKDIQEKKDCKVSEKSNLNDCTLVELYDEMYNKLMGTIYNDMLKNICGVIKDGRGLFVNLTLEDKTIQIYQMLKVFQCTPEMPDLSKIGGSKNTGRIRISMNVTERRNMAIIHQSITGLYEKLERINDELENNSNY